MNKIGTKIIDTERCILRRIVPDDYQMMYENWAKYEEVCRYFPFNPVTDIEIYKEKVHKWADNYESDTYFHWVIEWKENHELIGTINLGNVEESCFMSDTCYMLSPQYWGQGIMTEVLQAVLKYAFDIVNIGLHFILKNVRPYAASCSEAQYCCRLTIGGSPPLAEQILRLFQQLMKYLQMRVFNCATVIAVVS